MEIGKIFNILHSELQNYKHNDWFHVSTDTMSDSYKGIYQHKYIITEYVLNNELEHFLKHLSCDVYKSVVINSLYSKMNPIKYINIDKEQFSKILNNNNYNTIITSFNNREKIDKLIYLRNPITEPVKLKVLYSYDDINNSVYIFDNDKINVKLYTGIDIKKKESTYEINLSSSLYVNDLNITELFIN